MKEEIQYASTLIIANIWIAQLATPLAVLFFTCVWTGLLAWKMFSKKEA